MRDDVAGEDKQWPRVHYRVRDHVWKSKYLAFSDRNKKFYEVLDSYDKISNIPVLLNTSFNGHGEPIIDSPAEAFAHLESGMIDALVAEDFIYFK